MCHKESISVITVTKTKEIITKTRRRTISVAEPPPTTTTTSIDDDVYFNQNNKLSTSSSITTTKPTNEVVASIDNNEENINNNHNHDSIVATSSIMVGSFIPNDIDSDDDNIQVLVEEDNDNNSCNMKQIRNKNLHLSSLSSPSPSPSSRTRSSRRSMTRLLPWITTSLALSSSSQKQKSQQQVLNSINLNKKEKKSLISRRSFRHSQSCNDIDIGSSSRQTKNNKSDFTPIKKRSFLFRRNSTKSNIHTNNGNDIEQKEEYHQEQHDLRLRNMSSFDGASSIDKATLTPWSSSSSNNDNGSNCSVVSSVEDMMEYDNVMSPNIACITYDCNNQNNNNNIDNDSSRNNQQQQVQQEKQLPDLYGQIHVYETPELVEESLQQMNIELVQHNDINERLAEKKWNLGESKVYCNTIKILFLRACCFRMNDSVERYITYWNKRILLFGMDRAFQPLTLSSLTSAELHILETGSLGIVKRQHQSEQYNELIQHNTTTDDNDNNKYIETRDIIILDYTLYDKKIMATLDYSRVVWYIFHSIMEDSGSSKRGVVFIVVTKNCSMKQLPSLEFMKLHLSYFHNCIPVRLSGMHIIYMPTIVRFVVPIINRLLDDVIKQRLIFHVDIKNEIQCITKLCNKYGININMIPKYIGGSYEWNMKHIWIPKQLLHESNNAVEI